MSAIEISNWISIYVATAICCSIAMTLSIARVAWDIWQEQLWREALSMKGCALFVGKTWWRWQKAYLTSTPVTLAIVGAFAWSLNWS